ncbi:MAG: MarR family transcriptional regulator [Oscillospiraceae bacterium]|jgi:DNA-binding MarR family transcriptional regulator|nr:MarR family transcriptional regulator [Oscillospiraceae bacterium]
MRAKKNHEKDLAQRKAHYESEDINGKLVINLRDLGHTLRGLSEGRGSQRRILIMLSETGTITQRELTQRLGIQPGSASEVIAKLENAGLLSRVVSETDRRTAAITLTQEGERQAAEAKALRDQRHREMFAVLTDEEKALLLALLEKVNTDWEGRYVEYLEHHHGHCHGPHSEAHGQGEDHSHNGEPHFQEEGQNRHACNHDCVNCPHPCPKGRARLEGER